VHAEDIIVLRRAPASRMWSAAYLLSAVARIASSPQTAFGVFLRRDVANFDKRFLRFRRSRFGGHCYVSL